MALSFPTTPLFSQKKPKGKKSCIPGCVCVCVHPPPPPPISPSPQMKTDPPPLTSPHFSISQFFRTSHDVRNGPKIFLLLLSFCITPTISLGRRKNEQGRGAILMTAPFPPPPLFRRVGVATIFPSPEPMQCLPVRLQARKRGGSKEFNK